MAKIEFTIPIKGYSEGLAPHQEQQLTSGHLMNVRPRDVLENRMRLGQRPGLDKKYSQQIGNSISPVVEITEVAVVA